MVTFSFNKKVDEIENPELMPEDWYDFEIFDEPKVLPNKTLKEMISEEASEEEINSALEDDEKAGFNLVITLESESAEDKFCGRKMKLWLPYPSPIDETRYDGQGNKVYDRKMGRLVEFTEAFQGEVRESDIYLSPRMKGCCYVIQQKSLNSEEIVNSIDWFSGFKKYGGA